METYVIFSPSEGFWKSNFGWGFSPEEADLLYHFDKVYYSNNPNKLPGSACGTVNVVLKKNYAHLNFEELVERITETLEAMNGTELESFAERNFGIAVEYQGDSLFIDANHRNRSFDDVVKKLIESLKKLDSENLGQIHNEIQTNVAYPDGDDGYFLQLVK